MNKLIKFITLEEFKKILSAEKKQEYKLAYILGFGSGLRLSEIIGYQTKEGRRTNKKTGEVRIIPSRYIEPLTADDINLERHQIRIIGAKGDKDRIAPTSPYLNKTALSMLPLKLKRRTVQWRIKEIGRKELDKDIHFHTLRHGFGNYMVNDKNVSLPMVQQMMGHSRIDTTGIYTKANPIQATNKAWETWID